MTLRTKVANAKPGDIVRVALAGPAIPAVADLALAGDLTASTSAVLRGNGTWTATLETVGGKPFFRPDPSVGRASYTEAWPS